VSHRGFPQRLCQLSITAPALHPTVPGRCQMVTFEWARRGLPPMVRVADRRFAAYTIAATTDDASMADTRHEPAVVVVARALPFAGSRISYSAGCRSTRDPGRQ
jgi:hypothetical protein